MAGGRGCRGAPADSAQSHAVTRRRRSALSLNLKSSESSSQKRNSSVNDSAHDEDQSQAGLTVQISFGPGLQRASESGTVNRAR